jgi:ubiquinone/menaquinone biosynthesis C-methylase UbiE
MTHTSKITVANLYNRVAPQYGQIGPGIFHYLGCRLAGLTAIAEGDRVLDIATGRGASLLPAARITGDLGSVIGIDLASSMLKETAKDLTNLGMRNATLIRMDAENLAFRDAAFDRLLCGFAIFLFSLPEQALSEWYRVLRPGGSVGISVTGSGDERWRWYEELLLAYHHTYKFPLSPNADGLRGAEAIKRALADAHFADIQEVTEEHEFLYADEEQWWGAKWTHGARYPLEHMSPDVLTQFKKEVFAKLASCKGPDGLREKWRLVCLIGLKPGK